MIAIHSNIGGGKSTLIKRLSMIDERFKIYLEPIDIWRSVGDLLNLLYSDPYTYAFKFQTLALITRLKQYSEFVENKDNKLMIWERGCESDKIFQSILTKRGYLTQLDNEILKESYKPIARLNIYIRTPPEVCLHRILSRGRREEENISFAYLQELHDEHEKVFTNCFIIDGENIDIQAIIKKINEVFD
jgi:deoxyadenosine/deoxycytidine kinase